MGECMGTRASWNFGMGIWVLDFLFAKTWGVVIWVNCGSDGGAKVDCPRQRCAADSAVFYRIKWLIH